MADAGKWRVRRVIRERVTGQQRRNVHAVATGIRQQAWCKVGAEQPVHGLETYRPRVHHVQHACQNAAGAQEPMNAPGPRRTYPSDVRMS